MWYSINEVINMNYEKLSGFSDEIAADMETQFSVLQKLGIRYFEPRGINGKNISLLSEEEVYDLKGQMKKYGIRASSIGSPIGKVKLSDDFEEHFDLFQTVVAIAKKLNCRYIRIFSFYGDGTWTAKQRDLVIARLSRMLDYAKAEDIVLLHENEKDIYGDTAERCLDLMKTLASEHFGAVFDPANFVQCGEDTKEAFIHLHPYIRYMHIKDAKVDGTVVPAGAGVGNIEYILKNLLETEYDGFLSLEPHLGSFEGLASLELDDKMGNLPKGGEGTFTLAKNALDRILERI